MFFNSIDRRSFPVIDYPSKNFCNNAKKYCNDHDYLVIRITDPAIIDRMLVKTLDNNNVISTIQIFYPIYLKMLLDYVQVILKRNVIFYMENSILYILCTKFTSRELISVRNKHCDDVKKDEPKTCPTK